MNKKMAIKMHILKWQKKIKEQQNQGRFILVSESPILIILNSPKLFPIFGQGCREFRFPRATYNVCNRIM